jgi:predicted membrane protein (TIGR00267 family)
VCLTKLLLGETSDLSFERLFKRVREIGPILRRLFINTLFDATFTLLGIIIGSVFTTVPDLRLLIGTSIASSLALGISSGVSVYESETIERERRVVELEKALFVDLKDTIITKSYRTYALILAFVNFLTPLICCGIILIPFILALFQILDIIFASWISIILALCIIFVAGIYFGRGGKTNPLLKGLRMVFFGIVAFISGYVIQALV